MGKSSNPTREVVSCEKGFFRSVGIKKQVRTLTQEVCGTEDLIAELQGGWKAKSKIGTIYDRFSHLDKRKKHLISWSDTLLDMGMDIDLI